FLPRHIILLNLFIVGLPSIIWSLAPPQAANRSNPQRFLRRILRFCIPNGLVTGLAVIISYVSATTLALRAGTPNPTPSVYTTGMLVTLALGILAFWLIPRSLQAIDNLALRRWQLFYTAVCIGGVILLSF